MKILALFLSMFFSLSVYATHEPTRLEDWTLTSPFTYGFSKGASLGIYDAREPLVVVRSMPSVAEMPIGLVGYVETNNRFSNTVGIISGASFTLFILFTFGYGVFHRIKKLL